MNAPGCARSAHLDPFARSLLPPPADWPLFDYSAPHLSRYPNRLNAAATLIDGAVAAGAGDRPIYFYDGQTWTYRHLQDRADRIARVLVEDFGLVPGNRVLLRSGNNPMAVACWLAVLKAGGIAVFTVPLLRHKELIYNLNRVAVRFALCELSLAEEMETARPQADSLEGVAYFTPLGTASHRDAGLDRAADAKPAGFASVDTAADDIAVITFTSGTTGNPKAAAHFHRDLIAVTDCWPQVYTLQPDDVLSGSPPLAFTYGLAAFLVYPLRYRAAVAFPLRPTPDCILDVVARHRVTSLYAVPTSYNGICGELHRYDISSLRKCTSAGENLQMALWQRWQERTGIRIVNGIGSTEMLTHYLSESMAVERPGSTGRAIPGYTARVIDDAGNVVPPGTRGRLAVRGPTGCRYLDDIGRQREMVQGGWNVTGDIFEQDEDGRFWFINRADDMIVSAGYNISPHEVEQALLEHPLVGECVVVGVPDSARGNLVRACIVLREPQRASEETARDLQNFVKSRIAPYKYPRDVRFYDALPKTATGKIQRYRLKAS